jgi:large subunit ribosomal protein L4
MPNIDVRNSNNEKTGEIVLNETLFGAEISRGLLHEVVLMQQASMRQGTASTKTRGFVSGGGKKPWKQKGTGRARAGSSRSPLWRGGAIIFGPLPRSYAYSIPKKKARKALCVALSSRVREGKFIVLEGWEVAGAKTKHVAALLEKLEISGRVLIVFDEANEAVYRGARNLQQVSMLDVPGLNVYNILESEAILTTRAGIEKMSAYWGQIPAVIPPKVPA